MDDLLESPGITVGDFAILSCEQGVEILGGVATVGVPESDDPFTRLAGQVLSAELNLNVGTETCPVAEEAVTAGHVLLSSAGFDGLGTISEDAALSASAERVVSLLEAYGQGELCR
jgi:hypothetical protein